MAIMAEHKERRVSEGKGKGAENCYSVSESEAHPRSANVWRSPAHPRVYP